MLHLDNQFEPIRVVSCSPRYERTRALIEELDRIVINSSLGYVGGLDVLAARDISFCVHFRQADRPDGEPYINHPLEVTLVCANEYCLTNGEALKAALLHDSVEDQPDVLIQLLGGTVSGGVNLQDEALRLIGERFGKRVREMVAHLTNPDYREMALQAQMSGDPRGELELKRLFYKQHFLDILERDPEAFLIKLADFSRNAFELSRLPKGDKLNSLRAKYAPVILALVEKLKEVPDQGHLLTPWRDDLRAKLLWVYARDYATSP